MYCPLPHPCLPSAIQFPSITTFNHSSLSLPHTNLVDSDSHNILYVQNLSEHTSDTDAQANTFTQSLQPASLVEEEPHSVLEIEDTGQPILIGEVPDLSVVTLPKDLFTRLTESGPFVPARVEAIVNAVRYGDHLTGEQQIQAQALVAEFADVFTLLVREVKPVDFIDFCLQIPPDATFTKKVHQRPLTKPQRDEGSTILLASRTMLGECCLAAIQP
jgi:hypothetical protein